MSFETLKQKKLETYGSWASYTSQPYFGPLKIFLTRSDQRTMIRACKNINRTEPSDRFESD